MRMTRSFTVPAPRARVLDGLTDVERVAESLPGGVVEGRRRGERYGGSFALQLGTQTAPYTAIIGVAERDDAAGRAVVTISGHDDQGDGTAEVTAAFSVREEGGTSAVDLDLDIELGGRLAAAPDVEASVQSFARTSVAALRSGIAPGARPPARGPEETDEVRSAAPAAIEPLPPAPPPAPEPPAAAAPPPAPEPPAVAEPPAPDPAVVATPPAEEPPHEEPPPAPEPPSAAPPPLPLRAVESLPAEPAAEPPPPPPVRAVSPAPEPPQPPASPPQPPATPPPPPLERTGSVPPPGYQPGGTATASSAKAGRRAPRLPARKGSRPKTPAKEEAKRGSRELPKVLGDALQRIRGLLRRGRG
jgi:carbon monoxide dehydrogenase subunit G